MTILKIQIKYEFAGEKKAEVIWFIPVWRSFKSILPDAKITIDEVQFGHLDDYHAALAFLSTLDVGSYYFTSSALGMDLLMWADANDMYDARPSIEMDKRALTEDMILYRCFGGRSAKRFTAYLTDPLVSPQFLRKLVKVRKHCPLSSRPRLAFAPLRL